MSDIDKLRASEHFDAEWYLTQYPDVAALGMDPAEHYLKYGASLMRDPSADFSTRFYASTHKVVVKNNLNPLLHFLSRRPQPHANPNPKAILWATGLISSAGDTKRAIKLAEKYLQKEHAHAINLLRANDAVVRQDRNTWVENVNEFLDHFGNARIALHQDSSSQSLFSSLATNTLPQIKNGPIISVIMPAWNASKTIEYAIRSILTQTWRPVELIVVDDASDDDTWRIISRLAQEDDRLKPLRNSQNAGPYVSKNIALKYATGHWITGHDADDWAHPQRLERHLQHLNSNKQTASLMGMLRMSGTGTFSRLSPLGLNTIDGACVSGFISMMCERIFFHQKIGHWDEMRFGADSELIGRIEKATGKTLARFHSVGMICLDNPEGLTNHPKYGHRAGEKIAPERKEYKASFQNWHANLRKDDTYLDFPQVVRRFPAPEIALNKSEETQAVNRAQLQKKKPVCEHKISADLCVVTNLRFPGGNASSTLDELRYFRSKGLKVKLIHCPVDQDLGKPISERFYEYGDELTAFDNFSTLTCKTLIVRHPAVITSKLFSENVQKLDAQFAYCVVNNSSKRTSGEPVYAIPDLLNAAKKIPAQSFQICPISPLMRDELRGELQDSVLSKQDWTPTFDLESYHLPPRSSFFPPFTVGRHGRDGKEKWLEDETLLRKAFPSDLDFNVEILGGATQATSILGELPKNWTVYDFGSLTPKDYLKRLSAFVYFPNSSLNEGFGRTIVEAMIAGIPVILPPRFEATFDNLPLYCEPDDVVGLVRRLGNDDNARVSYLTEVQNIAISRYSSTAIEGRFADDTAWEAPLKCTQRNLSLTKEAQRFRKSLLKVDVQ